MKPALLLLGLLIIALAGCSTVRYVAVPSVPACIVPDEPEYVRLDPGEHIANPANIERLMFIISDMTAYNRRLKSTIKCFSDFDAQRASEEN